MKVIALVVSICLISAASPAAANRLRLIETTCKPQQLLALNGGNSLSVLHRAEPLILLLAEERGLAQLDAAGIAWRDLAVAPTDMRLYAVALDSAALSAAISWNPLARLSDGRIIVAAGEEELLPDGPGISKIRLPKRGRPLSVLMDPPYAGLRNRDYDPAIQALADGVTAGRLEQLLSSLVGFGTRYSTTVGCQQAVDWAAGFFQALGLDTETFPHTTGHAPNVLAWQTGMVNPDRIWILCGHIDSTSRDTTRQKCPGADDNGTGASLTMLAAELLHLHQFEDTILYALWTGEEQGLWGSSAWADYAAGQGMNIQACLNFDMVGWVEPAPEDLEVFVNPSSELLGQDFIAIGELYSTLPFSYRPEAI